MEKNYNPKLIIRWLSGATILVTVMILLNIIGDAKKLTETDAFNNAPTYTKRLDYIHKNSLILINIIALFVEMVIIVLLWNLYNYFELIQN